MPPTRQARWSRSSGVCGDPPSPCGVKPRIRGGTGGAEVENLLIVLVQDIFAAREHLPVLVDLVLGIEIDAGIGIDLAGLAGAAEALGDRENAGFDQPSVRGRDGKPEVRQVFGRRASTSPVARSIACR